MESLPAIPETLAPRRRAGGVAPAPAIALLLFAWYVVIALYRPVSHDEQMYVAAGSLVGDHVMYKEFAYLQAPYLPYVYSALFAALPCADWWIAARLTSLAAGAIAAWCVWRVARTASGSTAVGLAALTLFATHHVILFVLPLARNHLPALACLLAAYVCWLNGLRAGRATRWHVLGGALSGCAAGLKLTILPPALALLGCACWNPGDRRSVRSSLSASACWITGFALTLAPAVAIMHRAGWDAALFDNYCYHQVNARWRSTSNHATSQNFGNRVISTGRFLIGGSGVCAVLALGIGATARSRKGTRTYEPEPKRKQILISTSILLAAALCAALVPTPLQRDYLAAVTPFLAILAAAWAARARFESDRPIRRLLIGLTLLSAIVAAITSVRYVKDAGAATAATPWRLRAAAHELAAVFAERGKPDARVATLAPIWPLSAGLEIYPELASGPFLFRVGDEIDAEQLRRRAGISPQRLSELLDARPPDGVLVGFEGSLEDSLGRYAEERGYRPFDARFAGGQLYLRDP